MTLLFSSLPARLLIIYEKLVYGTCLSYAHRLGGDDAKSELPGLKWQDIP